MPKKQQARRSKDFFYSNELESGVQYVFLGYDDKGRSMWRNPIIENLTMVGGHEAGLREMRRKGVSVKEGITKKIPGNWKPGQKGGGWKLNG